jgi:predicted RNA binding protein YcfA (HicA-like mRNA interferase family)
MRIKKTARELAKDGWTGELTNGGHIRWRHPDAIRPIISGSTPSDHRAVRNTQAKMRRALRAGNKKDKP